MDADDTKDFERFIRDKRKAEAKNKLHEVAQLCNCIGEIHSKYGRHEEAIEQHTQEKHLSEALGDKIGEAVACRKIGECHCALGQYSEALQLQKRHLTLARECANHLEEQRAWATIGRTYLCQSETRNLRESSMAGKQAEKAFVRALEACERVKTTVKLTEYMAMKGRLYLNIGLVYDARGDVQQSADVMKRAVSIAEKFKLEDELFMCHASLANMYQKGGNCSQALRSLEMALRQARRLRNKIGEKDMLVQKAMVHVMTGDFLTAKHCLKKAHRMKINLASGGQNLRKMFKSVSKMQEAVQDLETEEDEKHIGKLHEVIADCSADLGNSTAAIEHYLKVLEYGHLLTSEERAAIYVSLAQTFSDIQQYDNALIYYQKELEERKDNPEQSCRTLLNMAELEEVKGSKYTPVCKIYMSAFETARKAKHGKLQVQTLRALISLQKLCRQEVHLQETEKKLAAVLKKLGRKVESGDSDSDNGEEEEITEKETKEDIDEDLSLSDLTVSEESEDDNKVVQQKKSKLARRNEKGETPLHRACIDGNLKKAKSLITEGHPVNPRDYCGWLPIHEASNHGHIDVVELLLDSGAWINDRGGDRCGGVTPLIDAANCGNLQVVRLLAERGANVLAKDDDGKSALDCLQSWHARVGDVIGAGDTLEYKQICTQLERKMGRSSSDNQMQAQSRSSRTTSVSKKIPIPTAASVPAKKVTITSSVVSEMGEQSDWKSLRLPDLEDSDGDDEGEEGGAVANVSKSSKGKSVRSKQSRDTRKLTASIRKRPKDCRDLALVNNYSDSEDNDDCYRAPSPTFGNLSSWNSGNATMAYQSAIDSIGSSAQKRLDSEAQEVDSSENKTSAPLKKLPALLNDEDDVGDDWLINDVKFPKLKKKSAETSNILSTNSIRTGMKKRRLTVEESKASKISKFSELMRRRNKLSDRAPTKHTVVFETDSSEHENSPARHGSEELPSHNDVVSSSGIPLDSDTFQNNPNPRSEKKSSFVTEGYAWDSDDDLLCQIDTVYDDLDSAMPSVDHHSYGQGDNHKAASQLNTSDTFSSSPVFQGMNNPLSCSSSSHKNGRFHCAEKSLGTQSWSTVHLNDSRDTPDNSFMKSDSFTTMPKVCENSSFKNDLNLKRTEDHPKPTYKNSIRIKVKIGEETLLVPIQSAEQEKSISWLAQQVGERYFNMFFVRPSVTLRTQDGMMLCPSDIISTVLLDNDSLTTNVTAWERPGLGERYAQACQLHSLTANGSIRSSLQDCNTSGQLSLNDLGLGISQLQPVLQALEGHKTLTELHLSGNRLGDAGLLSLMKLLVNLPILRSLSLEANSLSADSLTSIAMTLKKDLCLQTLCTLSLSHNCFDDIAARALASVVELLPSLTALNIASCNFSSKLFIPSFVLALRGRRIEHINIAENQMGEDGLQSLLASLHADSLLELDISHTRSNARSNISQLLQTFVTSGECCLTSLNVAGCHLTEADVLWVNRLPVDVKSLQALNISQNSHVNNKSIQKLLYLSSTGGSNLVNLTARGCSISAPLGEELVEALRVKLRSGCPLRKFVFSCRGLRKEDSEAAGSLWTDVWKESGQVKVVGTGLSLTTV